MEPQPDPAARRRLPAVILLISLFVASAALELLRVAADAPWPGLAPMASHLVSVILAVLWIGGVVAIALRRRSAFLAQAAWILAIAGVVVMVPHATVTRLLGSWAGAIFLPLAIVGAVLVKKMFDRGELRRLRRAVRDEKEQSPAVHS